MATLFFAIYPSATTPTWARGGGTDGWSGTPTAYGQQTSAPAAPQTNYEPTISWTGSLTAGTAYKIWAIWDDGSASSNSGAPFGSAAFRTSYALSASAAGSYTVTGQSVVLTVARKLDATAGAYVGTGNDATLAVARQLAAAAGSYSVTGQAVILHAARALETTAGSYATTGHDVELTYAAAGEYSLESTAGAYAITGHQVALRVDRTLLSIAGSYAVTSGTASLDRGRTLTAQAGSYAVTGPAVSQLLLRALAATAGVYTVTGRQAVLHYSEAEEPTVYTALGRRRLGVTPQLPPDRRIGRALLLGGVPRVGGSRQ